MVLNALDEVLFWNDIEVLRTFTQESMKKHYPHDPEKYFEEKNTFLLKHIPDKEEFVKRLESYVNKGKAVWISGGNQFCDDITMNDLRKSIMVSSKPENGKNKVQMASKQFTNAPDFWDYYTQQILSETENVVCELTIGAGAGTIAVMRGMKEKDLYIGVDIDFVCTQNANAIARYLEVNGLGIVASLWNLPFENEIFTVVCSNQGLEECREIPTIIKEAARVLKKSGRLVLHCVKMEKSLWHSYFMKYGFSAEETREWLRKVRLFSGAEQLIELAGMLGFKMIDKKTDEVRGDILTLEKQ